MDSNIIMIDIIFFGDDIVLPMEKYNSCSKPSTRIIWLLTSWRIIFPLIQIREYGSHSMSTLMSAELNSPYMEKYWKKTYSKPPTSILNPYLNQSNMRLLNTALGSTEGGSTISSTRHTAATSHRSLYASDTSGVWWKDRVSQGGSKCGAPVR